MCGICGYVNIGANKQGVDVLQNMVKVIHHRGPDSQGYFEDQNHQVFLGHSRLSIIDISDNGKQPMSLDNLTIVFNGEIYNYKEVKKELVSLNHTFRTNSDTEVILHAYREWGTACVSRFIGMFAFVIYDSDSQTLSLFRDRAGVKPLYYYFDHHCFIFGSELKAFHQNPLFKKNLDFDALGLYMKFGYIPTPYCVFKNTYKLTQGSYLVFDISKGKITINKYWDLKPFYLKSKLNIPYEEALEQTEQIMISAFNYRMVSDVPVGVFLSAGFDSTCVSALLQKNMTDKLRTFTIGFDSGNNEAPMAKEIASYLGTDHTELYCSESDALSIIKDLPYYYDEPYADSSAIPTILVSRLARQHVKVALSADGGDEIFAGYNGYTSYMKGYHAISNIPKFMRGPIGHMTNGVKTIVADPVLHRRFAVFSDAILSESSSSVARSLREAIQTNKYTNFYGDFFRYSYRDLPTVYSEDNEEMTVLSQLLYADYIQYMQDDILVKVDRASMSASLEGRNPLLDHRIVEYAAQLPDDFKFVHGVKKKILKDIVYKYIPKELIDKPKTGFSVPLANWLNDALKDCRDYYLSDSVIDGYEVFDTKYISVMKKAYSRNHEKIANELWKVLQFQMWYEKWMK